VGECFFLVPAQPGSPGQRAVKRLLLLLLLAKLSGEMLSWLSVWSEVQRFAYGPADATATPSSLAALKSRMVLPFCWRHTRVVLEKMAVKEGCCCLKSVFCVASAFCCSLGDRNGIQRAKNLAMYLRRCLFHNSWRQACVRPCNSVSPGR